MNRIPLEIVADYSFAHDGFLASLLGKMMSAILGAVQSLP
jgi:hypothetical protein